MIYCDSVRFSGSIPNNLKSNKKYRRFEGKDVRKIFLFNTISGHACLIKKDLLPIALPLKKGAIYDWWIGVVAGCNGGVSYVPQVLVYQRVHEKNSTTGAGFNHVNPKERLLFKKMVIQHLNQFVNTPNMPAAYKKFAAALCLKLQKSLNNNFYWPLFSFLVKHSTILFWYKKRKFGLFSYVKHSYMLTKRPD